ncbi:MAG: hypothetical protein HRU23_17080 [Gammaproteobacteria bacterium]|nr:hypothetical protein [Gammaproteobacteria bacterium]
MNKLTYPVLRSFSCATLLAFGSVAHAATLSLEITNLTQGIHFTPFIVATHQTDHQFFEAGMAASTSLQAMAEGGDISGLDTDAVAAGAMVVKNPNLGLLMPGQSVASFDISANAGDNLSLAAMLLPTNDAFAGIDSWSIPTQAGTYTLMVNAYDAGTEANNELITADSGAPGVLGIPADPSGKSGTGGSGVTSTEQNMAVHIHRGSLGDDDAAAGLSDLDNTVHRWLNPVLKVTITVQ